MPATMMIMIIIIIMMMMVIIIEVRAVGCRLLFFLLRKEARAGGPWLVETRWLAGS